MTLSIQEARQIAASYMARRTMFPEEIEDVALIVVLLNFGEHLTEVFCTRGEWKGIKADLQPADSVPTCPNGHPLYEARRKFRLGLIEEV